MARSKRWNIAPPHPDAGDLAARLKVSPLVSQILLNRGISSPDDCTAFLRPSLKYLHSPGLMPNLTVAAERIAKAIRDKQTIVIYGDYDVDGITATTILWHAIRTLGGEARYYIPHRIDEGYGLNGDAIKEICEGGAGLIVSVDCGITAFAPATVARGHGVDLIITDHHEYHKHSAGSPGDVEVVLPDCFAIVHPRLPLPGQEPYPNPYLCGAGVAFKLAWGIGQAVDGSSRVSDSFREFLVEATALAALGTIADVVPLIGENRVLAAFGLAGLPKCKLPGIRALIESAQLTGKAVGAYDVGFRLGPRLNACGRMGHAKLAVELFTEASPERAVEIATFLVKENTARQAVERNIMTEALAQAIELGYDRDDCRGIVLASRGWHAGVIGVVASRIMEKFHRPTVMIAIDDDGLAHGSGRSVAGFHLAEALDACDEYLKTHGGHEMAAGLTFDAAQLPSFREAFQNYARAHLTEEQITPRLRLDATAQLCQISAALITDLERLGPCGEGNPQPILYCPNVTLSVPPKTCGANNDHLILHVRQGKAMMKCIAFKQAHWSAKLQAGSTIDLAVTAKLNEFRGYVSVELEVKDLRLAEQPAEIVAA